MHENEDKKLKLSPREVFSLGFACGSFSVGEIDQGIHAVLPATDENKVLENGIFEVLFSKYFDLIPDDLAPEKAGEVYMGAVQAFAKEHQLEVTHEHFIATFEKVKESA